MSATQKHGLPSLWGGRSAFGEPDSVMECKGDLGLGVQLLVGKCAARIRP